MVSPLNPLVGAGMQQQPIDIGGALAGGMMRNQQMRMGEQDLQMGAQQMQMNDQTMQMRSQDQQQQVTRADYEMAVQRMKVIGNIAKRVRQMPPESRAQFVQSIDPDALKAVGLDPEQAKTVPLDDKSLDDLIAQTSALIPEDESTVQSSQRLAGGITQSLDRNGNIVVKDAANRVLTGEDAIRAIQEAEQRGVDRQRDIYSARQEGTLGTKLELEPTLTDRNTRAKGEAENVTKTQKEYFDQLHNIDGNIQNYAEGIRLLREDGANTGVVASRLPSMKAASIKLDNLRNRLGLDVVSNTTFGALSEAELAMALDTALPKNLQPEQMAVWLEERMAAQMKLRGILDNALQYLSIPGNTLADLRAEQRSPAASPTPSPTPNPTPARGRYQIEVMD